MNSRQKTYSRGHLKDLQNLKSHIYIGALGSSKLASKSQDRPFLFGEEWSAGRSQKTSRFGTSTLKSGYDEDIALPASSPPKPALI
jgi:hypothetical protein